MKYTYYLNRNGMFYFRTDSSRVILNDPDLIPEGLKYGDVVEINIQL